MAEAELRRTITAMQEQAHRRNRQLDAMHWVWCDGPCRSGIHRYQGGDFNEQMVRDAEVNTLRLRRKWTGMKWRFRQLLVRIMPVWSTPLALEDWWAA